MNHLAAFLLRLTAAAVWSQVPAQPYAGRSVVEALLLSAVAYDRGLDLSGWAEGHDA